MDGNVEIWKEVMRRKIYCYVAVKHAGFYKNAAESKKLLFV